MDLQIIQVPYDSGHKSVRTGRGPDHFLQHRVDQLLRDCGHQVGVTRIETTAPLPTEIETAFDLNRLLAGQVSLAVSRNRFPLVLAGNCNSCLGTIAGIGQRQLGIVWFDAHGDFNTPETTVSGFLDGMGLAMAAGHCWRLMLNTIPGFSPIPEANILHIGARDLDPAEEQLLRQSEVGLVTPGEGSLRPAVEAAIGRLRAKVATIYLHVDVDVLDAGAALPNRFAAPGGLPVEFIEEIIARLKEQFDVAAGAITSFDPGYDQNDQVLEAGLRIIKAMVA